MIPRKVLPHQTTIWTEAVLLALHLLIFFQFWGSEPNRWIFWWCLLWACHGQVARLILFYVSLQCIYHRKPCCIPISWLEYLMLHEACWSHLDLSKDWQAVIQVVWEIGYTKRAEKHLSIGSILQSPHNLEKQTPPRFINNMNDLTSWLFPSLSANVSFLVLWISTLQPQGRVTESSQSPRM